MVTPPPPPHWKIRQIDPPSPLGKSDPVRGAGYGYFLAPHNVLETCRVFVSHGFLKNAKFVGMDQITCKNCNKSSWIQVSKILLTRNRPEQFPSFFFYQWNQTTMRWCCISKAYHFLKMLPNCVDSIQFHYFYDSFKKNFILKYFENGLIEFVQTLPWLRQLWQIHTPLSDFFKKTPGTVTEKLKDK